jgi:hypothetical protein
VDSAENADDNKWCDQRKPSARLPYLTIGETKGYIRTLLRRRFKNAYRYGEGKKISSCERWSRTKARCKLQFGVGDVGWKGRSTIWYSRQSDGSAAWNYAYVIKRTNYYCLNTDKRHCTKTLRVT